jgi:hypothetical protein
MALKLNIRPDLDKEIESLYPLAGARSKTEYINMAIAEMNRRLKRKKEIEQLKQYFDEATHCKEEEILLSDFTSIRRES